MPSISSCFAFLAGLAAGGYAALVPAGDSAHADAIGTALATVGATLLGFVLTAMTILFALVPTRLFKNMQKTGHFKYLFNELFATVIAFLLVAVFATLFLLDPGFWERRFLYLSATYFGVGISVLVVSGWHFYTVMRAVVAERL